MELPQPRQKYEHWGWRALSQGKEETSSGQPATNWGALTNLCRQSAAAHTSEGHENESHRQSRPRV